MIVEINSLNLKDLFKELYTEPVLFVEELAILENRTLIKSFYGYYNPQNIKEFLLIAENNDGTKSCFFYPETTDWLKLNLKKIFSGKIYLQTNLEGKKIISSLEIPYIVPHTVLYFRYNPVKIIKSVKKNDLDIKVKEKVENGKLKNIEINSFTKDKQVGFSGSDLINSKTAMIGLGVEPEWREQGIGKMLLLEAINKLLVHNIEPVYACDRLNIPSYQLATTFFTFAGEFICLFLNNWSLVRPQDASPALPDSIFVV